MIDRNNPNSIMGPGTTIGVLTDSEVLLVEAVGGKRVLRSLLLPAEASDLSRLLNTSGRILLTPHYIL